MPPRRSKHESRCNDYGTL
uniref:Uncharacterized protein n=1 Tax=Rhizophora mucronata TaxID=61149 RepID=A0A2P2QVN4_RHIMU